MVYCVTDIEFYCGNRVNISRCSNETSRKKKSSPTLKLSACYTNIRFFFPHITILFLIEFDLWWIVTCSGLVVHHCVSSWLVLLVATPLKWSKFIHQKFKITIVLVQKKYVSYSVEKTVCYVFLTAVLLMCYFPMPGYRDGYEKCIAISSTQNHTLIMIMTYHRQNSITAN